MSRAVVTLTNPHGLHARPAAAFTMAASAYESAITVEKNGRAVNAKSIMKLMALDCRFGDEIVICADGTDAAAAVSELASLVEAGLGEAVEAVS
jgi:phosphotransferase system HPr (HPr) family protein